ncbi:MAG: ParA family protein [Acidobacteria bacterium]|nr:ParA family protein [Acidobacteriota bacterium]
MSKIIAVSNQKGGVGKTTTTINLAASMAMADQRVLVVDMDPQGNLTSGLGQKSPTGATVYESLVGDAPLPILSTPVDGLSLVPAGRHLAGAEVELVPMERRERRLEALLSPIRARYDFILIDTPPSLGLLTLNALVAADTVLIPLHCEYFALEGLADLMATLARLRQALNPRLDVEGVVLTMFGERTNLSAQVAREIRQFFESKVFTTVIPRNVRLAEAPSHGLPVLLYDPRSKGADAYVALALELLNRNGGVRTTQAVSRP